jgi:hypothetical protein
MASCEAKSGRSRRLRRLLLIANVMALLVGCGAGQRRTEEFLRGQVGVMTYDQALVRWGKPTAVVVGERVQIASWGNESLVGGAQVPVSMPPLQPGGPPMNFVIQQPVVAHGWELRLSFDKSTNRLVDWHYREW